MSFEYPWVLLFLTIPLILAFWEFTRDSHAIVMPFDHAKKRRLDMFGGLFIRFCHMIPALILAAAIIIIAGPRRVGPPEADRVMTNIIFCLDLSGSMSEQFGHGNRRMPRSISINGINTYAYDNSMYTRYDAAVESIRDFAGYREGDAFGLTFFGSEFLHWLPVTRDINALKTCVDMMDPNTMPRWFGGTRICNALRGCIDRFKEQETGDRLLIVITDGESQDFGDDQDVAVANELREARITTYFVSINPDAIVNSLMNIAAVTGGEAMTSGDQDGLKRVFRHIDNMEKAKMKQRMPDTVDYNAPFAFAGVILAAFSIFTLYGLRFTPW